MYPKPRCPVVQNIANVPDGFSGQNAPKLKSSGGIKVN
jgi:hypothetical protein